MTQPRATKVLVIGYVWPEPRSSAAGGHMMQILETFLQQGWDITFSSPAGTGEHRADLTVLGIREVPIELNNSSFDTFISELAPDIVLFDRFMMEEQFGWRVEKHCPDALRVLETSDLQSLRDARHQRLKERLKASDDANDFNELFAPALREEFELMAETDLAKREIAAIYRCDLNLMISEVEIELLVEQFKLPRHLLHWCPLMVDLPSVPPVSFEDRAHFLSIGNFRHAPNWDAVLWMKTTIWPLIREQLPTAQLHIYGAYTPPKATALHNPGQGFHVMNWAEDALKVMSGGTDLSGAPTLRCRHQRQNCRRDVVWHAHDHNADRRRSDAWRTSLAGRRLPCNYIATGSAQADAGIVPALMDGIAKRHYRTSEHRPAACWSSPNNYLAHERNITRRS